MAFPGIRIQEVVTGTEWSRMVTELFAVVIWPQQNKMPILVRCYCDDHLAMLMGKSSSSSLVDVVLINACMF